MPHGHAEPEVAKNWAPNLGWFYTPPRRNQAGGGNWTHAISSDLIHWFHIADALGRGPHSSTWDNQGACDGTVSFPDLGKAPFDGSTPIM